MHLSEYFHLLRPASWVKNFFVFAPLFFARELFSITKLTTTLSAFLIFCLTASSVYIINDIVDRKEDKRHSLKRYRPLASGKISLKEAVFILLLLMVSAASLTYSFAQQIAVVVTIYFLLNVLYSFYVRRIPVLDILLISSFYLLRIEAGGRAAQVPISAWLILCTIFLALFLIIGKRKAEIMRLDVKREVLNVYTQKFLEALFIISAGLSIISYSLYTLLVLNSRIAVYSIFFVLLGMFRYILLSYNTDQGECPEKTIWGDNVLVLSALGWTIFMCKLFYF